MNNDLISRSALKEFINSTIESATKVGIVADADYLWELLNYAIDNAPTVPLPDFKEGYKQAIKDGKTNFSRPHGKWIKVDRPYGGFGDHVLMIECSKCHTELVYHGKEPKFCLECGAEMKEADNV